MTSDDLPRTLDRLEAALGRLEAAGNARAADDDDLADRHARLRDAVARTIADLDALARDGGGG